MRDGEHVAIGKAPMKFFAKMEGGRSRSICVCSYGELSLRPNGKTFYHQCSWQFRGPIGQYRSPNRVVTNPIKSNRRSHRTETRLSLMSRLTAVSTKLRRELLDDRAKSPRLVARRYSHISYFCWAFLLQFSAILVSKDSIELRAKRVRIWKNSEKHAKEAQRYLQQTKARRDKADSLVQGMTAENAGTNPDKASKVVEKCPAESRIVHDRTGRCRCPLASETRGNRESR